jgi:hypothetical protein
MVPPRINRPGSEKGHGFSGGGEPLEHTAEAQKVFAGSAGREGFPETGSEIARKEKSSEGEIPRA